MHFDTRWQVTFVRTFVVLIACGELSRKVDGSSPYTFHTEEKTWDEAQKTCNLTGGNLATITSQEEQDTIMSGLDTAKQWWIGVKVNETDRTFYWADGRTGLAWSNWKKGEPNNFAEGDPCVRLAYANSVWQWKDNLCSVSYSFICREKYDFPYTFHREEKTRDEAQNICELNGGNLVTIINQEEQNIIMAGVDTTKQWWIGLKVDETSRDLYWADGRRGLAWSNWLKGEPNNFEEGDPCVRMVYKKSVWQWRDNLCSVNYSFICRDKYDLGPYTFHTEEKTRDEAQKTCELNGGNLLTITSQEEQDIIMADIDTTKQWWIGVKVDETDRSFHWADGRTGLAWSNWKKGEPNNFQEGDPCVRLAYAKSVWQWKDNLCSVTYAFICRDRYDFPYTFHTEEKTRDEAQRTCNLNGGHLLTIKSQEEQDTIMAGVDTTKQWWIGVKVDETNHTSLYWADGEVSFWSNWMKNEPNNFAEGDPCVRMKYHKTNFWQWKDNVCSVSYGFICRESDAIVHILHTEHEVDTNKSVYHAPRYSDVSLFQVVSRSSSVTTPMHDDNSTLFVHHTEKVHGMAFHTLNVLENTTNTEFLQTGYQDVSFALKSACTTFHFTESLITENASVVVSARLMDREGSARTRESLPWLTEITADNFTACTRERVLFYGHHTSRISFVALAQAEEQDGISEHGVVEFFGEDWLDRSHPRHCKIVYWKKRYDEDDTGVFVTPYWDHGGEIDIRASVKASCGRGMVACIEIAMPVANIKPAKLHYIVASRAALTNCSGVEVPNHMYCYEDTVNGYSLECPRSCPRDCLDDDEDTVCASDLGSYTGTCNMHKTLCELYAKEHLDNNDLGNATEVLANITLTSAGPCDRNLAYETGTTAVTKIQGMPAISCATVALDPSKYTHLLPILVSAAADWSDVADRSSVYTANSVQTWVNGTELTICLYVVGAPPSQLPRVVWVAYQENLQYRTSGTMVGGTIVVDTFVSGSVCAMVNLPSDLQGLILGVQKTSETDSTLVRHVGTAWTELYVNASTNELMQQYICKRQVKNFDRESPQRLNWIAFKPSGGFFGQSFITFEQTNSSFIEEGIKCMDINDTSFVDNNTAVFPITRHVLLDDGSFPAPMPLSGKPGLSTSRNLYTDWTVSQSSLTTKICSESSRDETASEYSRLGVAMINQYDSAGTGEEDID